MLLNMLLSGTALPAIDRSSSFVFRRPHPSLESAKRFLDLLSLDLRDEHLPERLPRPMHPRKRRALPHAERRRDRLHRQLLEIIQLERELRFERNAPERIEQHAQLLPPREPHRRTGPKISEAGD